MSSSTPKTTTLVYATPAVTIDQIADHVARHYGLIGAYTPLPSERDLNLRLDTEHGERFVVKVANVAEEPTLLDLQHSALLRIASRLPEISLPRVVAAGDGATITSINGLVESYLVRLVTWLPGVPLATVRPRTALQLGSLGELLGRIDTALAGLDHRAARRSLKWELGQAAWVEHHWDRIAAPERRALAQRSFRPFREQVLPRWGELPASMIYNDANDYNILVAEAPTEPRPTVGVIDFGDLVWSATVAEVAIAAAYGMLDTDDPLAAAALVVEGYHRARPLSELELEVLYPMILARLVVSLVNSAMQQVETPDNVYLQVSDRPAWRLLEKLDAIHPRLAWYRFRAAVGLEPCPDSTRVRRWLEGNRETFFPIIATPENIMPPRIDLSVGSQFIGDLSLVRDEPRLSAKIDRARRHLGARIAVGEYDEARLVYTSDLFRAEGWDGPEWRTIHVGLDLFGEAGCPVRAPIAGKVHSVRNNLGPGDYGPTVIVEHRVTDRDGEPLTFHTLYGHLDLDTLRDIHPGLPLSAGDTIGRLGTPQVNGGWPPHVHFQIAIDVFDRSGEFPGVARPSERAVWKSVSPAPHALAGVPNTRRREEMDAGKILSQRRRLLGANLSVSYQRPLHIVRGWMQHLYDVEGRQFLDAVNNVPHVGHSHPRVVEAGRRQLAVLNTNSRYLHQTIVQYADRLTMLLPKPLSVCYFVNSGSEANELALRLAWTHTGRRGTIVVDGAYHGNTATLVSLSPYKCEGPGGRGLAPFARKVPLPDPYRGRHRAPDATLGERYAAHLDGAIGELAQAGSPVAAFLSEPILSCGGQIVPPPGYLAAAYRRVRAAGGLAIADEVQVGFGRVGGRFWGFETQEVVPDIVVMGKPAGNGHPLGIVVTTPEIAASFANGMEFFSTFGGNPVSCAIGLAVLDVIHDEDLQARAGLVGRHLMAGLGELAARHAVVGNVRGMGLFVGLEFVGDRETRTPDAAGARYAANRLRDRGILVSTDGPDHNVIKIKPPLCFGTEDADRLVATLDRVLAEDPLRR